MNVLSYQINALEDPEMHWGKHWEVLDGQKSSVDRRFGLKYLEGKYKLYLLLRKGEIKKKIDQRKGCVAVGFFFHFVRDLVLGENFILCKRIAALLYTHHNVSCQFVTAFFMNFILLS